MKIKNKGKVYPSPSSPFSPERDALSVLNLLPAAILALASLLSLEDREVLAYLITRSLKTTTNTTSATLKKSSKKPTTTAPPHKPPVFECDCFDCYTSYWFRWDSSPDRELINQAIEAFEDHLANGEITKRTARSKRRDKTSRRVDAPVSALAPLESPSPMPEVSSPEVAESFPATDLSPPPPDSPESCEDEVAKVEEESGEVIGELPEVAAAAEEMVVKCSAPASSHKGLARKVLPDVLGLFNSRLWSLWNPNV